MGGGCKFMLPFSMLFLNQGNAEGGGIEHDGTDIIADRRHMPQD